MARPTSTARQRPSRPTGAQPARPATTHFEFRFDPSMRLPALMFGVVPATTGVDLSATDLTIRFGPWSLTSTLANVLEVNVTGPYSWIKVAGPPHLSRADTGVTFATSTREGVCIRFVEPVPAALPFGLLRHEGATVTVSGPERFARELTAAAERARRWARPV